MRQKYFNLIQDVDFACLCYQKYYAKAVTIERIVNAGCACVSTVGIAGWAIWEHIPLLWSILIAVSQTAAVIFPYTPYRKRRMALDYMIPRLHVLVTKMNTTWQTHCDEQDYDFRNDYLEDYAQFRRIDTEFLLAEEIPISKKIREEALQLLNQDLSGQFNVKEDDLIAEDKDKNKESEG